MQFVGFAHSRSTPGERIISDYARRVVPRHGDKCLGPTTLMVLARITGKPNVEFNGSAIERPRGRVGVPRPSLPAGDAPLTSVRPSPRASTARWEKVGSQEVENAKRIALRQRQMPGALDNRVSFGKHAAQDKASEVEISSAAARAMTAFSSGGIRSSMRLSGR